MFPALSLGSLVNLASLLLNLIVLGSLRHLFKWSSFPPAARKISWYPLIGHKYPPQKKSQNQKSWATSTRPCLAASMLNWNFFRLTSRCFGWSVLHIKNISSAMFRSIELWTNMTQVCSVLPFCCLFQISYFLNFWGPQDLGNPKPFLNTGHFCHDQLSVQTSFRSDARKRLRPHPSRLDSECFAMAQNPQKIPMETTIFRPNNSRQQISQRLETYLRKHHHS